ncbi:MAG: class I SAM-dependent methyltransferase [Steroidobacteraceae bacterium]|jgi:methyltransferase family protein
MSTTALHYQNHLGPVYTWMVGDLDAAFARGRAELDELGLPSSTDGAAIDLGAGFGLHSIPLAERGYAVTAIDGYEPLLHELRVRSTSLPIKTIVGDLSTFRTWVRQPVNVILCMGDTLTQLPDFADVDLLLDNAAAALTSGGVFAATFRDYVSKTLQGDERFIPVRSDDNRILTCFLEYGKDRVTVHDLLHEREQGRWRQRVSSYLKLRLCPERIVERLANLGFVVSVDIGISGMTRVIGVLA